MDAPRRPRPTTARTLLAFAATSTLIGIALGVAGGGALIPWITLCALGLLVVALHRLGREGPDAPQR